MKLQQQVHSVTRSQTFPHQGSALDALGPPIHKTSQKKSLVSFLESIFQLEMVVTTFPEKKKPLLVLAKLVQKLKQIMSADKVNEDMCLSMKMMSSQE